MHMFKIYKAEVELLCGNLIKCLRIDCGGEYYQKELFKSIRSSYHSFSKYNDQLTKADLVRKDFSKHEKKDKCTIHSNKMHPISIF